MPLVPKIKPIAWSEPDGAVTFMISLLECWVIMRLNFLDGQGEACDLPRPWLLIGVL